jgi:hypothetical protein
MRLKAVVSLCVALAATSIVSAQPAPLRLTLDDAVRRATDTSHRLAEARARQQGADASVVVRR